VSEEDGQDQQPSGRTSCLAFGAGATMSDLFKGIQHARRIAGAKVQVTLDDFASPRVPPHVQKELDMLRQQIDEVELDMTRVHKADKIKCRELMRRHARLLEDTRQIKDALDVRATMIPTYTIDFGKDYSMDFNAHTHAGPVKGAPTSPFTAKFELAADKESVDKFFSEMREYMLDQDTSGTEDR
jgi:hypothetical protein